MASYCSSSPSPLTTSHLVHLSSHEVFHPTLISLHRAFALLQSESRLQPPFSLSPIPSSEVYSDLNLAIAYGVLSTPHFIIHLKHLHSIVVDGYQKFTSVLVSVVDDLYPRLLEQPRVQLLWTLSELINVAAVGVEDLVFSLLRRINGGNFSASNLWLAGELVKIFSDKWDVILEERREILGYALFVYLRLLADHYRLRGDEQLELLKRREVAFCVRVLRKEFGLCLGIGRDLVRLLQDVAFIPEFVNVWRDLLSNPNLFGVPEFTDLARIHQRMTPHRYFSLCITVEMETQLRFMLTNVKWGSQTRYQKWFVNRFLCEPEQETLITDMIRFVCCVCHPDGTTKLGVLSRWATIGWLLSWCRKNYFQANAKLALFYDWLYFDRKVDDIMNIEPAIALMVYSLPKYADLTNRLMEFLFLLIDNYDACRKDMIFHSVCDCFHVITTNAVFPSLSTLTSCNVVATSLRERLSAILQTSSTSCVAEKASKFKKSEESSVEKKPETKREALAFSKLQFAKDSQNVTEVIGKLQAIKESSAAKTQSLPSIPSNERPLVSTSGVDENTSKFRKLEESSMQMKPESKRKTTTLCKSQFVKDSQNISQVIDKLQDAKESSAANTQLMPSVCSSHEKFSFGVLNNSLEKVGRTSKTKNFFSERHGKMFSPPNTEKIYTMSNKTTLNKNLSVESSMESLQELSTPFVQLTVPWNIKNLGTHGKNSAHAVENQEKFLTVNANESESDKEQTGGEFPAIPFEKTPDSNTLQATESPVISNLEINKQSHIPSSFTLLTTETSYNQQKYDLNYVGSSLKSCVIPENCEDDNITPCDLKKVRSGKDLVCTGKSGAPDELFPVNFLLVSDEFAKISAQSVADDIRSAELGIITDDGEFCKGSVRLSLTDAVNNSADSSKLELIKESPTRGSMLKPPMDLVFFGDKRNHDFDTMEGVPIKDADVNVEKTEAGNDEISSRLSKSDAFNKSSPLNKPDNVPEMVGSCGSELLVPPTGELNTNENSSSSIWATSRHLEISTSSNTVGFGVPKNLMETLGTSAKLSMESGLKALKELLTLFAASNVQEINNKHGGNSCVLLQDLAFQITEAFKPVGYSMFLPLDSSKKAQTDDELHSATALVIQAFIFYPDERMRNVLLYWSRNRCPVGARILSYASRLASESRNLRRYRKSKFSNEITYSNSLLRDHIVKRTSFKDLGTDSSVSKNSSHSQDSKLIEESVDEAFFAYRTFVSAVVDPPENGETQSTGSRTIDHDFSTPVFTDMCTCLKWSTKGSKDIFQTIFTHLRDLSMSRLEFIQMVIDSVNQVDLVSMQYNICLKQFCIFGRDPLSISKIVKSSFGWKPVKQKKLWVLLSSELTVNNVNVEEVIFNLCDACSNPVLHSVAIEGLFMLIRWCSPTTELIHTVMTLPEFFGDFATAVLCFWSFQNNSAFVTCLADWLQKLSENGDTFPSSKYNGLNHASIESLLKYIDKNGLSGIDVSEVKRNLLLFLEENTDSRKKKRKR